MKRAGQQDNVSAGAPNVAEQDDNPDRGVPAARSQDHPERAPRSSTPARSRRDRRSLAPEFLSLTYTLPHHLVEQVEDVAEATNRSPSEVLADSARLYLRVRQGMRRRARVSTVEGFAYQEVELSEAVVDEELLRLGESTETGQPVDRIGPSPPAASVEEARDDPEGTADRAAGARNEPQSTADRAAEARNELESTADRAAEARNELERTAERAAEARARALDGAGGDTADVPTGTEEERQASPPHDVEPEAASAETGGTEPPAGPSVATDAGEADRETTGTAEHGQETTAADTADAGAAQEATGTETADPGWAVLGNARRRSRRDDAAPAAAKETTPQEEPGEDGLRLGPEGPSPDDDAVEDIRGRLLPLAGEPIDSERLRRVLEAIMREVDRKDSSPPEHSRKVASLARRLGELRGLQDEPLLIVELAGLVHDIGKACVRDELIRHVRLTKEELAFVRRYPEMGSELLETVPSLEPVVPLVRAHQERWDGSGYPDGLERSEIPVGAQIVAICDIYDVLITERRYRPAYTEERAVQIIRQNVGSLWNPEIANVFIKKVL